MKIVRKVFLLCIISSSIWTTQSLHAQSGYYLDTIANFRVDFIPGGEVHGTKYHYNNDNKVSKIVTDQYILNYIYDGNTTTELIEVLFNGPYTIKRESIYNDDGQPLVHTLFEDEFLSDIDSFFYENNKLHEHRRFYSYNGFPSGLQYVNSRIYSYTSDDLIESLVSTSFSPFEGDSLTVETENYQYDQNLNVLSWFKTTLELDTGESDEESISYSYNDDQKLDTLCNYYSGIKSNCYSYAYLDNFVFRDQHIVDMNDNFTRINRAETKLCQHNYFEFDSVLTFRFVENGDSIITRIETNHEDILSFVGDTLLHRNSVTNFDASGTLIFRDISKKYYVKNPEITGIAYNSLPTFTIYPNPVLRGSVLRIPDLDFDFDQVVFYRIDGRSSQSLKIDLSRRQFNAPQEAGTYLLQLWNDRKAVTQAMKVIVQ